MSHKRNFWNFPILLALLTETFKHCSRERIWLNSNSTRVVKNKLSILTADNFNTFHPSETVSQSDSSHSPVRVLINSRFIFYVPIFLIQKKGPIFYGNTTQHNSEFRDNYELRDRGFFYERLKWDFECLSPSSSWQGLRCKLCKQTIFCQRVTNKRTDLLFFSLYLSAVLFDSSQFRFSSCSKQLNFE